MNKLFEEVKIKNLVLKNRIAVPAMVVNFSDESGYVFNQSIVHYQTLAKGGSGLIIQEATSISKTGRLAKTQLGIWKDEHITGLKGIVDVIHNEGCSVILQIHHAGIMSVDGVYDCPSDYIFTNKFGETINASALTTDEIKSIQSQFINAALRAFRAGYDGIELHGAHSYLISQFLNKNVNTRNDIYGLNPETFIIEIVTEIRKITNADFIIGIRLGAFEPTLDDGLKHVKMLESYVDFFNISYGYKVSNIYKPDNYQFAACIYGAKKIKEVTEVPVLAVYGITNPQIAQEILLETKVDMINIGRGMLVNPNWANDAKNNLDTGYCHHCNVCIWINDQSKCIGKREYLRNKEKSNVQ